MQQFYDQKYVYLKKYKKYTNINILLTVDNINICNRHSTTKHSTTCN